jgi:hypothetical protein
VSKQIRSRDRGLPCRGWTTAISSRSTTKCSRWDCNLESHSFLPSLAIYSVEGSESLICPRYHHQPVINAGSGRAVRCKKDTAIRDSNRSGSCALCFYLRKLHVRCIKAMAVLQSMTNLFTINDESVHHHPNPRTSG